MTNDPRHILDHSPMNAFQIGAVCICILLNALDGFDVLAISFASPGIAAEWNIDRAELGVVLSMELLGMAVGSIFLGGIADRCGRRRTILSCLLVMTTGMTLAALTNSILQLLIVRFVTGLGIGGMLASINAMVSEYSNRKNRNLCVILMASGYPLGAVIGGAAASGFLTNFDWRVVFYLGALATGATMLLVYFRLPESIEYLAEKQPVGALEAINGTLQHMGHNTISHLPAYPLQKSGSSYAELFSPALISTTIILTLAYFAHVITFYFMIKWIPKIVVDMQYTAAAAGGVLVWANVGGALGTVIVGLLTAKFRLQILTMLVILASFLMVIVFGQSRGNLTQLMVICAIVGFFSNAGIAGLYALFTQCFPAVVRASGTGFAIGVGRFGAALSPIIAGLLFSRGFGLEVVSIFMATGALCAALALLFLRRV